MLKNININFIKHSEISDSNISKIIALKQQHWSYSYTNQNKWISENLSNNDYHILITDNEGEISAYMNLVNRMVNNIPILGIGNVCVDKDVVGNGMGTLLMHSCQYYSRQLSLDLILLCKEKLVDFYEKCGFYKYQEAVYIDGVIFDECLMFSNNDYNYKDVLHINKGF